MSSPLRGKKLMNDIMYAISMYFAHKYDDYLLASDEIEFVFVSLCMVLGIQLSVEKSVHEYLERHSTLWCDIIMDTTYMVSRTVAFLLVSLTIEMVSTKWNHLEGFWGEEVFFPIIFIFMGIATMKHVVRVQEEKDIFRGRDS